MLYNAIKIKGAFMALLLGIIIFVIFGLIAAAIKATFFIFAVAVIGILVLVGLASKYEIVASILIIGGVCFLAMSIIGAIVKLVSKEKSCK